MFKRAAVLLPLAALTVSGMAGLVDEVVWSRVLTALFGSALTATGLLTALFMACLGLGAHWGGRFAPGLKHPLAAYGLLETVIGALVLLTPALLKALEPAVAGLYLRLPAMAAHAVTALICMLILGPIILLMGATFPIFLAWALRRSGRLSTSIGRVYGVNTIGAVLGTILGGLILMPALGIRLSLTAAAGADLAVGLACWTFGRRGSTAEIQNDAPVPIEEADSADELLAWGTAFLGGCAALILEIAWFRGLTLIFGSSIYALSLMLAAFLAGLGAGSLLYPRLVKSHEDLKGFLGRCHAGIALSSTLVSLLLQVLPLLFILLLKGFHGAFAAWSAGSFAILILWFLVPTLLMGMALPAAIRVGAGGRGTQASRTAGKVYAASSVGSALGALAAAFLLVPVLGLRGSLCVAVLCSLGASAWALARSKDRKGLRRGAALAGVTAIVWALWFGGVFPWDWRVLTGGYYAYAHLYSGCEAAAPGPVSRVIDMPDPLPFPAEALRVEPYASARPETGAGADRLLAWEEGRYAQVAVVESGGVRSLLINGKADASSGREDMRTQLLLGHLPVLLSPDEPSGKALVIGLGSAVTLSAVATWPFAGVEAVEIEPAVVRAARWFEPENRRVLASPKVLLRVDDARRLLMAETEPLSLITSEPSNLWMSGVSLLFTKEFFGRAALRLGERGVLCQWIHLYQIGPNDVRTLLATLGTAFPRMAVFSDGADLLIVASRSPLVLDPAVWRARLLHNPAAMEALARAGFSSGADLAEGLVADGAGAGLWSRGASLHSDDQPILEFTAARSLGFNWSLPIRAALVEAGRAAGPLPLGRSGEVR
jgi:spermidine synthase